MKTKPKQLMVNITAYLKLNHFRVKSLSAESKVELFGDPFQDIHIYISS